MIFRKTIADFIAGGKSNNLPVGTVLDLQGDLVAGDNTSTKWKLTSTSGTASTRVNKSTFNDASGKQWKLVCGEITTLESFTDLETLQPEDGDFPKRFVCVERANAEYLLQPSGYVALVGDVTFANGRVASLQIDGKANALWFGVKGDFDGTTGTDNYDSLMDAKDRAMHVYVPDGYYGYSRALKLDKHGFVLECESPNTIMRCTGESGVLSRFPEYCSVLLGTYSDNNITAQSSYELDAITWGSSVTLTNASDAANFNVGDVVYLRSSAYMTVSGVDIPRNGQLLEIKSISGADVEFYGTVDFTESSLLVNLTSGTTNYKLSNDYDTGLSNFASKNVKIIGGTWETPESGTAFCGGGGALNCVVDVHTTRCRNGAAYGNLYYGCEFKVVREEFEKSPAELAYNSRNNIVEIIDSKKIDNTEPPYPIWINSSSVGNSITINNITLPADIDDYAVRVSNSSENTIKIGKISGLSAALSVVHLSDTANAGDRHATENNSIEIGFSDIDAPNCVHFDSNGMESSNTVKINSNGTHTRAALFDSSSNSTVSNSRINSGVISLLGAVSGCYVENSYIASGLATGSGVSVSGVHLSNVRTLTSNKLKDAQTISLAATATNATPFNKSTTIQAGAFSALDLIDISLSSLIGGANSSDNKSYALNIGGVSAILYQTASVNVGVQIKAKVTYATNTAAVVSYEVVSGSSVVESGVKTVSGLNFSGLSSSLSISVTPSNASDSILIRDYRVKTYSANAGEI